MELGLGTVLTQEVSSPLRRVDPAQLFVLPCSFELKHRDNRGAILHEAFEGFK